MNDRPTLEITADTVNEAIARGLAQLGVGPGDVIVEVLEEPSRGVFGIGAHPAKVRLQLLRRPGPPPMPSASSASIPMPPAPPPTSASIPTPPPSTGASEKKSDNRESRRGKKGESGSANKSASSEKSGNRDPQRDSQRDSQRDNQRDSQSSKRSDRDRGGRSGDRSSDRIVDRSGNQVAGRSGTRGNRGGNQHRGSRLSMSERVSRSNSPLTPLPPHLQEPKFPDRDPVPDVDEFEYNEEEEALAFSEIQDEVTSPDSDLAKTVLLELLKHMGVRADVRVTRATSSQDGEAAPYLLNVEGREGRDVSVLIGRRGDTLTALQYVTRLIASRRLGHRANIVVDVDSYKARRSQKLRDLAVRMADKAVLEARTIVLEPMPPHERRMIHMTLRNRTDVSTRSTGEGEARKVTIVPKTE